MKQYDFVITGGGAAGFFAAINLAERFPEMRILIAEKHKILLTKVKVSGGGRCNVTHNAPYTSNLLKGYPRGSRFLKKVFSNFAVNDTIEWFKKRGVELKTEADGRMFPVTDSSETVINCFLQACRKNKIEIQTKCTIREIHQTKTGFLLKTNQTEIQTKSVLLACGGLSKRSDYDWLSFSGHNVLSPLPSLFTFNIQDKDLHALSGISQPNVKVKIEGQKLSETGALLITHWGLSGPAVLKLSSVGAELLNRLKYQFNIRVHWNADISPKETIEWLKIQLQQNAAKKVKNTQFPGITSRLWFYLIQNSMQDTEKRWVDLSPAEINRLENNLFGFSFSVKGKTTFKEEFVTCGGIDTTEVNPQTMESKLIPGLYFAGEILNIDGITGGFNFQAAWSTAYTVALGLDKSS